MKFKFFAAVCVALLFFSPAGLVAQTNGPGPDLQALVAKINAKLMAGQRSETNLTAEIAEFDTLLNRYKEQKTDPVAQILFAKAKLYVEVLMNPDRGIAVLQQLKSEFPDTELGKQADGIVDDLHRQLEAIKMRHSLVPGAVFPDFEGKDLGGKTVTVGQYKGKVVLLDFWATWCVPCQMQLPYVRKAYEQFHDRGFEIVGITLDNDEQRLQGFMQDKKMSWRQIYEGKGWGCSLVRKYGVQSIPTTFLLDSQGKIIARDLKGDDLVAAVEKALPASASTANPSPTSAPQ